ncbi:cysteine desulfurase-like protein [Cesiribacter andamanensis]|uniref:Cysteine desulfurase n=1 Tax=Cesiribacter andamanensis AMV16 TaxID=1279009 RepID=M7N775_9BACT|nr:cysteine desulfurase-like protein [Cesiribacter andamanensis]EMR03122.1 Cysteine desulfurase [Cesiribacter andamanensis AMV16]
MNTPFPIRSVRAHFPALNPSDGSLPLVYFDGPGGTQMASQALMGMMTYISRGMANLHGPFPTSLRTDALLLEARAAMADFLHCQPQEVAFGQNMTSLAFAIARSLGALVQPGDEVVVTEADHRANVDPWASLARDRGAGVRYIPLNPTTYTLELDRLEALITPQTRLVAVGLSSNVTGTVTDVEPIIARAKAVGALVVLDAVHAVPHLPVNVEQLGCDVLLCSAYKFFGPHIGIAVIAQALFEKLPVYKLEPAPAHIPDKLETGTQNHEALAGLLGALGFIESLGEGNNRKECLQRGMQRLEAYESELAAYTEQLLQNVPGLKLYRAPAGTKKTPTFAFTLEGVPSWEVSRWFAERHQMCVADGHFYATTMAEKLGVLAGGGWVRIGLAPYTSREELERFHAALLEFVAERRLRANTPT